MKSSENLKVCYGDAEKIIDIIIDPGRQRQPQLLPGITW